MRTPIRGFAALLALPLFCAPAILAQDIPAAAQAVPLTVQPGAAFHVALEKKVRVKNAGVPVEGRLAESVYVFDHMVIPAGSQVLGRVATIEPISRKRRALAISNGDFTPLRMPHLDFDTLILKNGTRIPLHTSVSQGIPKVVHFTAGGNPKKKRDACAEPWIRRNKTPRMKSTGRSPRLKIQESGTGSRSIAVQLPYRRQWLTPERNSPRSSWRRWNSARPICARRAGTTGRPDTGR